MSTQVELGIPCYVCSLMHDGYLRLNSGDSVSLLAEIDETLVRLWCNSLLRVRCEPNEFACKLVSEMDCLGCGSVGNSESIVP